jgi:hypothetical protein
MIKNTLEFFEGNKDAFTSIGILLTIFISLISLYFSIRNNKAVHYVNAITKSRIEWVQNLRGKVAEFISNTNIYYNVYYNDDIEKLGEHLSKCQKACSEIRFLLNCCDDRDKEIVGIVDAIMENYAEYCDSTRICDVDENDYFIETEQMTCCKSIVEENIKLLNKKIQIYLKAEWNRIKYESLGKHYEKETQDFDYIELEAKYEDSYFHNDIWKRFCINSKAKIKRLFNSSAFTIILLLIGIVLLFMLSNDYLDIFN